MSDLEDLYGDCIFKYSRKQALEDGVLVDVTAAANTAGFLCTVVITQAVHLQLLDFPEASGQDYSSRLMNVFRLIKACINEKTTNQVNFTIWLKDHLFALRRYSMYAVSEAGDDPEKPDENVITILMQGED